jgi:hypothetical protein
MGAAPLISRSLVPEARRCTRSSPGHANTRRAIKWKWERGHAAAVPLTRLDERWLPWLRAGSQEAKKRMCVVISHDCVAFQTV